MVTGKDADARQHMTLELDLHRDKTAPSVARAAIAGLCETIELAGGRCQTLLLLVSEIVTNAVLHSNAPTSTPIRFRADADYDRVRVDVHDGGADFTPPPPSQRRRGGWGLHLVEREARHWGVTHNDGTLVWFELALESCAPAAGDTH
jgi:anti-sigma regulatory factor (Ser/Thr protein kinase)